MALVEWTAVVHLLSNEVAGDGLLVSLDVPRKRQCLEESLTELNDDSISVVIPQASRKVSPMGSSFKALKDSPRVGFNPEAFMTANSGEAQPNW